MHDVKKMKLYHNPKRIYNELEASGLNKDTALKVQDLSPFDQYHYFGTDSVDDAITSLNISSENTILEIGSGIGGPARYIAEETGCHVTALELQPELNDIAVDLTERCGLSQLVNHVCGDILKFNQENTNFDYVVSWLTFLHIPDRNTLLNKCNSILKLGGKIFIDDYYKRNEFEEEELKVLANDVSCNYLPTKDEYKKQLIKSGFNEIKIIDKTYSWKNFVKERKERFIQNSESQIEIHNKEIVDDLEDFFSKVSWLFDHGNLGGLRIIAKKRGKI
ncbi:MAG: hypothetical protein A4E26_01778 [Methanobacterium sp. PtaU1.Bin097]|jgi:cyclopropane fatty-acyl-phospholipid synthase-like methyltransferase|nr:MAG: hypothetical protein A4E26_01778 [Methanobacterium sp. PtaU1.Bin097]